MNSYYVYILTNKSKTFYIGMTNDLQRRVYEHKTGAVPGFTSQYHIHHLAYYEETNNAYAPINREKQLKGWTRKKKIWLIESKNPGWTDLAADWYGPDVLPPTVCS